ncbi:hypothetical protein [Paractinoplanes toevensis]|uniref:Uncharacterized protein n=1 Tax=Paractinoplanes toevensis TaxID=571911 RepID=A0A919T5N8_9ACTN|nr:hypothetical protein [Actinoplanes toevensis]GIM88827.1 hypothetical protein Ato02nite_006200 [Actinoplanes toevensis]
MTRVQELRYGDLFDLAQLPPFAETDETTRVIASGEYARVQTESYYEGSRLWLDTSLGFFRVDPDVEVTVARNEHDMFASRSKP